MTNRLDIAVLHRPARKNGYGVATERWSVDFLVDGRSLYHALSAANLDLCGAFLAADDCLQHRMDVNAQAQTLFSNIAADAIRLPLFVCPECGDLGCGALTCDARLVDGRVEWSRFAFENDYDEAMSDFTSYAGVGPFEFEADQYASAIQCAAA